MKLSKPLPFQSEWTFELLQQYDAVIGQMAREYGLDTYPHQVEMINSEQMMDAYAATGLPLTYHHWSFGKQFIELEKRYRQGQIDLAYEIVINSNPCRAYLMAESSLTMQAIVIAHACYGHNAFFKNNYAFNLWSDPEYILDYLVWAKDKINVCEKRYGIDAVEKVIDACHALKNYAVYRYKRPAALSLTQEQARLAEREAFLQQQADKLWHGLPAHQQRAQDIESKRFPRNPEENILRFIEENAPNLDIWQREIIHIVHTIAQYFYPQRLTKVMNEGWACFWHYHLLQAMYDEGWLTDEFMLQFIQYHSQVIHQPHYDQANYVGLNPYTLGYKIFSEIKRISQNPTDEDKFWHPDLYNSNWQKSVDFAMRNFKDESFISQYLSPQLIRELKLFTVLDDPNQQDLEISAIHNDAGYQHIREALADSYNLAHTEPNIQVYHADIVGDHSLTLRHCPHRDHPLSAQTGAVLQHLYHLWGYPVHIESVTEAGSILAHYSYPPEEPLERTPAETNMEPKKAA